jgi:microcystin degradation protein MlrC
MKVALLGIVHESNTFVKELTTLDHFRKSRWLFGNDIINEYKDAFHEIGGMIEAMDEAGIEIVPVMYAEATPGGMVATEAFEQLTEKMFSSLQQALPVDGCLVVPHGAGVCETYPDLDGQWLAKLREIVGSSMPIIGTIDPHANVSKLMIESTNALVAYKTNPHIDQRSAGKEAGKLMADFLSKKNKPIQFFSSLPLAISIEQQFSEKDPCKALLNLAKEIATREHILSTSIVLGFPYADVKEMGSSVIVISNDETAGKEALLDLENYIISNKELFNGVKEDISQLLGSLDECKKPVLLLDMGDNVGGGGPGDSTYLLDALEDAGKENTFICVYDPKAVESLRNSQEGEEIELTFGMNPHGNLTRPRLVTLLFKGSGVFDELKPRHGGQIHFDMGDIAIVKTTQSNIVMLTSLRVPPYSLQQLLAFGIDPMKFDAIVAKGVNAPIAAYTGVCETMIQVNTPGLTQADMTKFHYENRRVPLFPFEQDKISTHVD